MKKVLVVILLVLAVVASSLVTYHLFPQVVVEEPAKITVTWAIGHGYHYVLPMVIEKFGLAGKYSGGTVTLETVAMKSGLITEGLIAGTIQFAQRSAPAVLKTLDGGAPVKILASMGKKEHELWTSDPDIQSLEDFTKDTIINLVTPTSLQSTGLTVALKRIGKTLDDVTPLYVTHVDAYQLMVSGEIDCHYTGAPFTARYAREPEKYHLIGTDTTIFQMSLPGSALYATTGYVEENPEVVACVLASWYEAIAWVNTNPEAAAHLAAEFYGDPVGSAYQDWQEGGLEFNPTFGLAGLGGLAQLLYDNDIISKAYTADELLFPIGLGGR